MKESHQFMLSQTKPWQEWHQPLQNILSKLYHGPKVQQFLATILNAVFTEKKMTFVFSYSAFKNLLTHDMNYQTKMLSKEFFQAFLKESTQHHHLEMIKEFVDGEGTHEETSFVMMITNTAVVKYLQAEWGDSYIQEQKAAVLQYALAQQQFADDEEGIAVDEMLNKKIEEVPPKDHLFEARKKAIQFGLVKENLQDKIKMAEIQLQQATIIARSLYEKMRDEEAARLADEENQEQTLLAVETAVLYQKQKKLVMDLELNLLKLQEQQARSASAPSSSSSIPLPARP